MRIGFLSDAHGNPVMLAACLQKLRELEVSSIYFLGDAVGYLPGESKVLGMFRSEGVHCQKGNHEAMLLGELPLPRVKDETYRLGSARARLSAVDREYIRGWPDHRIVDLGEKKLLLVHGSPDDYLQGYVYPNSDLTSFDNSDHDAVFMGHTHYPFMSRRRNTLVVNVGSCGLPRDQGNLAAFAIFDVTTDTCNIYRLRLDAVEVVNYFGAEHMAQAVHDCFFRESSAPPVGQRLDATEYE